MFAGKKDNQKTGLKLIHILENKDIEAERRWIELSIGAFKNTFTRFKGDDPFSFSLDTFKGCIGVFLALDNCIRLKSEIDEELLDQHPFFTDQIIPDWDFPNWNNPTKKFTGQKGGNIQKAVKAQEIKIREELGLPIDDLEEESGGEDIENDPISALIQSEEEGSLKTESEVLTMLNKLNDMNVKQLTHVLKSLELPVQGNKQDKFQRLKDFLNARLGELQKKDKNRRLKLMKSLDKQIEKENENYRNEMNSLSQKPTINTITRALICLKNRLNLKREYESHYFLLLNVNIESSELAFPKLSKLYDSIKSDFGSLYELVDTLYDNYQKDVAFIPNINSIWKLVSEQFDPFFEKYKPFGIHNEDEILLQTDWYNSKNRKTLEEQFNETKQKKDYFYLKDLIIRRFRRMGISALPTQNPPNSSSQSNTSKPSKTLHVHPSLGFFGLKNTSNQCFMNSVIQVIYNTPELQQALQEKFQLQSLTQEVTSSGIPLAQYTLPNLKNFNDLNDGNQQDAHEFLLAVLNLFADKKEESDISNTDEDAVLTSFSKNYSKLFQTFGFVEESTIVCNECEKSTRIYTIESCLQLPKRFSVSQALDDYFDKYEKTLIEGRVCDACSNTNAYSKRKIIKLPEILIVSLKLMDEYQIKDGSQTIPSKQVTISGQTYQLYAFIVSILKISNCILLFFIIINIIILETHW